MVIFRKARRRKPGIYAYRTRKHLRRGTEWGYVGMSNSLPRRYRCHAGTCHHVGCTEKPWYDLKTAYLELRLPWWLGWKWFLSSVETIVILIARPRYNVQKNLRRGKVAVNGQRAQRSIRDRRRAAGLPDVHSGRAALDVAVITLSTVLMLAGLFGWLFTR